MLLYALAQEICCHESSESKAVQIAQKENALLKRLFAKPGWFRADSSDCRPEAIKRKRYFALARRGEPLAANNRTEFDGESGRRKAKTRLLGGFFK